MSSTSQEHPRPLGFLLQSFPKLLSLSPERVQILPGRCQLELPPSPVALETSLKQTCI